MDTMTEHRDIKVIVLRLYSVLTNIGVQPVLMGYNSLSYILQESMGTYHTFINPKMDVATAYCPLYY
jgi:hypothetical protein